MVSITRQLLPLGLAWAAAVPGGCLLEAQLTKQPGIKRLGGGEAHSQMGEGRGETLGHKAHRAFESCRGLHRHRTHTHTQ